MRNPNPNQQAAIDATGGPLLIIAGPGSGKTFTLVERIVNLVQNHGAVPEELLVVTFTDKAARELTTRVSNRLLELGISFNLNEMYLGTFHSICMEAIHLRQERRDGYQRSGKILHRGGIERSQFHCAIFGKDRQFRATLGGLNDPALQFVDVVFPTGQALDRVLSNCSGEGHRLRSQYCIGFRLSPYLPCSFQPSWVTRPGKGA